ncbi:hypothetical protein AVEN_195165-1 [Araneus ventricosus]|uniref:Uncharacterized protein n=1 Tax=Araneus ventricosus TaxID=182803 RepID=A0A4Y2T6A2_ARAVE|nr:hypothetical protein AVEN_195165-1 [Araneus ventricosus]
MLSLDGRAERKRSTGSSASIQWFSRLLKVRAASTTVSRLTESGSSLNLPGVSSATGMVTFERTVRTLTTRTNVPSVRELTCPKTARPNTPGVGIARNTISRQGLIRTRDTLSRTENAAHTLG